MKDNNHPLLEENEKILYRFHSCMSPKSKKLIYVQFIIVVIQFIIYFLINMFTWILSGSFELILLPINVVGTSGAIILMLTGIYFLIHTIKLNGAEYYITNKRVIKWITKRSRFIKQSLSSIKLSDLSHIEVYAEWIVICEKNSNGEVLYNGSEIKIRSRLLWLLKFKSIIVTTDCEKRPEIRENLVTLFIEDLDFDFHPNLVKVLLPPRE